MRIMPITNNYKFANNIKFSGTKKQDDYKLSKETEKEIEDYYDGVNSRMANAIVGCGILSGLLAIAIGVFIGNEKSESGEQAEFLEKVEKVYNSDEIKKDTFTVKNIDEDENPVIILSKKDGSKVVVDIANKQILE